MLFFLQVFDNPDDCGVRRVPATSLNGQNFPNSKAATARDCTRIAVCEDQSDLI
jgi:hypothetical protein